MVLDTISVLFSSADWAWPDAVRNIFEPRGVSSLLARSADDALDIIEHRRIHAAVLDMDSEKSSGLSLVRIIRSHYPLLPCILLARMPERALLSRALDLDVFSVIGKPVDMNILLEQLDRLFQKRYDSGIFEKYTL